jgi:glucokinase
MNVLGVDIGGTKIAAGIIDSETGTVLYSERAPTEAEKGGPSILARALALAHSVQTVANVPIEAVGIGAGGQIDYRTGVVLSATDILPGWAGIRLAEAFQEAFHVPAYADNDVNAFALGEHRFGAGRGATEAVFIALGTGVGGAIVTNGKLHRGKRGTGGELGHAILFEIPSDFNEGTLESLTSGSALLTSYRRGVDSYTLFKEKGGEPGSFWANDWNEADFLPEPVDSIAIGEAAKAKASRLCSSVVHKLGEYLGYGIASLANILDTERFVIGGGLSDLGDLILEPARQTFAEHALPIFGDTQIVVAELGKNSSVVGGGLCRARRYRKRLQ